MFDQLDTDEVFKALADPSRRRILDMLRAEPGLTVGDIASHFPVTRFAVMKHLKVLEEASLVTTRRDGRTKTHFLNAVPIQFIHDRWISKYSARWAASLTALKHHLETEGKTMTDHLKQVYQVYIRTTPEKLWNALTDPDMTEQYFHGTRVEGDFTKGGEIRYNFTKDDERVTALTCHIQECDPGRRLVHDFKFSTNEDPPSRVTYEMEQLGDVVKLTVVHDGFETETDTFKGVRDGWPPIFSGLKTLLETGQPLTIPAMQAEEA